MLYIKDYLTQKNYHPGEHSYSDGEINIISDSADLYIGKFCSIARGVTVFLGENHHTEWVTTYPFHIIGEPWTEVKEINPEQTTKGDVIIGNDVWIGTGATIMSGSEICDGAVIGACSVVAGYIPPYAIAVGSPARVVRYRFDDKTIVKLLKTQWWNWGQSKIDENIKFLCSSNTEEICTIHTS